MENDLEFLKEQLSQLDEPELPPTLTAEALFARLDEGTLALPEEAPEEEENKAAVIPWGRIAKRWAPLAACLVLVLLLHQGYQVGMARNFTNGTTAKQTADSAAPAAEAPESAAYSKEDGEALPEENANADFDTYGSASGTAPQENLSLQRSVNGPVSSAADAPAPEPGAAPDEIKGDPSGAPSTGNSGGNIGGSSNEDSSTETKPAPLPSPTPDDNLPDRPDRPNPPTGGGDIHPDTGGGEDGEGAVRPPTFDLDSGENGPAIYKELISQMEELAAWNTPDETLDFRLVSVGVTAKDLLMFETVYTDENQEVCYRIVYYCFYYEGTEGPWLKLAYAESLRS